MAEGRRSLEDMLDHSPDIMADAKVKVMMSDIYDDMVSYVDDDNARKVASLISNYGTRVFIEWFIDNVYLPKAADVKVMAYVAEHKGDICDVLGQAMSNLTAKEVMDNAGGEDEGAPPEPAPEGGGEGAEEGEQEAPAPSGPDGGVVHPEEPAPESGEKQEAAARAGQEGGGPPSPEPPGQEGAEGRSYDDELLKAASFVDSLLRGE